MNKNKSKLKMFNQWFIQMPNLKTPTFHLFFLSIIIFLLHIQTSFSQCTFPFQRCICTGSTPFCPCNSITSAQTLNLTSSYFSHLVFVNGYGCRPCPSKCRRCNSLQICTDCFQQFQLLNGLCEPCPINCKICRLGVCQECIDEYYIDYQQKCQRCPLPGTRTCTIDSLRSCQSNFWLDNNGAECVNCDVNCRTCSSTTKCTRCMDGFFESNFQCSVCKSECRTCLNNSTCIDCKLQGHHFNSTLSSCVACPSPTCQSCLSNGTCTLCSTDDGFYLDKTQATCLPINSSKLQFTRNCHNLTYTQNTTDYTCELCKDGYYIMNDYRNVSQLQCSYGCSILCRRCTGAHYGLCDACVSDNEFSLINRHCVPRLNLNDGTAFQYFYTAFSNSSFFTAPTLILPDSCWHEHVKGGASSVVVRFARLGVYKMKLRWKVYKYAFNYNNTFTNNQTYNIRIINSIVDQSPNLQSFNSTIVPFTCEQRTGFSSMCTLGSLSQCIDKNEIMFEGMITAEQNIITFSSPNSLIAISQLLMIGYRCGGLYGDGCIQCSDINTCTKCDNTNHYMIAEKCISRCPRSHYTFEEKRKCVEICPVGSYPDDSLHQCFFCQSPCETCNSIDQCVTCRQGFFYSRISLTCQAVCPSRHYRDFHPRVCERCTSPCLECVDNVKCVSCRQGFLRLQQDQTSAPLLGSCVLQCQDGDYTDLETMRCEKCSSPCVTCSMMADSCTDCVDGYFLMNAKCLAQCPQGYYNNVNSSKCERCTSSCEQCMNLTFCTQCLLGFYLTADNTCISTCPAGFYHEQILKQCLRCPESCSTCKSKNICSTCVVGFSYFQQEYTCVHQCPQFYYSLVQSPKNLSVCARCQLPCYDCSSENFCLSCYDAFLFNGSCMITCPSGYYANLTSLTCLNCDLTQCLQCKNIPTQCTKCNSSLLLVNGKCLTSCPYGFYFSQYKSQCVLCTGLCSSCLNVTFCLSCIKGFVLDNTTGLCLNTCKPGFYQVRDLAAGNFDCFPCETNCESCVYNITLKKSQCMTCKPSYSLTSDGVCVSVCPDGFYSLFGKCQKCSPPCLTCVDEQYCLSCLQGYGYVYEGKQCHNKGACVIQCPYGYFQTQRACLKCDSTCLTCQESATQCIACPADLFLLVEFTNTFTDISQAEFRSICVTKCPAGYVQVDSQQLSNYDQKCQKCAPNCKTCGLDYEECTSCEMGMILFQARCLGRCPITHYKNTTSNNCIPCGPLCEYCLNGTFCLQCHRGYSLNSQSRCVTHCAPNEYSYNSVCRKCMYPCGNCTEVDTCLSCLVGIFYDGKCIDQCPEGTYYTKKDGLAQCVRCVQNCSRCVSETQCLFCSVGNLYRSTCMAKCPDGFFPNYGACMQCQSGCAMCQNIFSCTQCNKGSVFFENKCISFCPVGYHQSPLLTSSGDRQQSTCLPCDVKCSKCYNSSNQCMQCNRGYFLYLDKCLDSCPSGSYSEPKFWVCEPCISPCETCSNAYSCESCIYGYLLYREAIRNQCVRGPQCPNNYYLNVEESVCQFQCPSKYYVAHNARTCSMKCPLGLVTFEANRSCLDVCPEQMWIDQELTCQPMETRPENLPYLKCQEVLVRNLLFLECQSNLPIRNMNQLTVDDFSVDIGSVYQLNVKSPFLMYLLILHVPQIIRGQHVTVELVNKYKLFSLRLTSAQSTNETIGVLQSTLIYNKGYGGQGDQMENETGERLLQEAVRKSYPVQNYRIPIYIEEYIPFTIEQREVGMNFYEIGQAISFAALALWFFSLLKNIKSTSLLFITNLQWLYALTFLPSNDTFPPNLNQFLESFKFSALIDLFGDQFGLNQQQSSLWELSQVRKDKFWAIHDFYNFTNSIVAVYFVFAFFIGVYVILYTVKRFFEWMSQRAHDKEKLEEEKIIQETDNNQNPFKETVKQEQKSQSHKSQLGQQKSMKRKSQNDLTSVNSHNSAKRTSKINNKPSDQEQSQQKKQAESERPWSEAYLRISKKSDILLQRFHFNYIYQVILLTSNIICLCMNIQLTRASASGLGQTILFVVLYIVFFVVSFYFYYQSQNNPDYKSRKPLRSTAFFFIYVIQIIVQNVIVIWTSFYFFVGFGFVCVIVNIVAWNWIYRKSEPNKCSYLQVIQVTKGFVLVMLVVGSMKSEKWDRDEIFIFGFAQIAVVFVLILLSSVSIAQQLFSDEPSSKTSIKNNSSAKYEMLKKLRENQEEDMVEQIQEETSGFEDDPQLDKEESFFSNRTPVQSDSDSNGDLIDFDESVESKKQELEMNENKESPPKNLFRYDKNTNKLQ